MDDETLSLIEDLIDWHQLRVDELQLIIDKDDAIIKMGDIEIEPGTPIYKGIIIGVEIALMQLGKLPISLDENK